MNEINFSKNLRTFRKLKRKTQKQVAMFAGVSQSYISDLELGIRSPSLKTAEKLSRVLKVSLLELLLWDKEIEDILKRW